MASIETPQRNGKYVKRHVRVDMTPMVDLGFLLITFFMFTTSMMESKAIDYKTPLPDLSNPMLVQCTKTVSLLPGHDGKVQWVACVNGIEQPPVALELYTGHELRRRLRAKQAEITALFGDPKELFVIVKPDSTCNYQQFIDVLDELAMAEVSRYAVPD